jgi:TPP-dependent pyruvate/acetoin dehydrogenase alpha subunit
VSGNLNIAALEVANTFNIQVQGTATGIPQAAVPNIGTLTSASNASGAVAAVAQQAASQARNRPVPQDLPSIITVEVIGYGGGEESPDQQQERRRKKDERSENDPVYDPGSALQLVGNGRLNEAQRQALTDGEKARLDRLMQGSGL